MKIVPYKYSLIRRVLCYRRLNQGYYSFLPLEFNIIKDNVIRSVQNYRCGLEIHETRVDMLGGNDLAYVIGKVFA